MTGKLVPLDMRSGFALRVIGDDGREYKHPEANNGSENNPPSFIPNSPDMFANPWINKRIEFEYEESADQLIVLRFTDLNAPAHQIKIERMSGTVKEFKFDNKEWLLRVAGDDGNEYFVAQLNTYLDIDQSWRDPGPSARELDGMGDRWIGRKVEFEFTIYNNRRLITHWIYLERRLDDI